MDWDRFGDSQAVILYWEPVGLQYAVLRLYVASKKSDPAVLVVDECGQICDFTAFRSSGRGQ